MFKVLSLAAAVLLVAGMAYGGILDPAQCTASSAGGCVLVCPAGDGDQMGDKGATISITINDGAGQPVEGIPATDFWLIDCDPAADMVLCGGAASSNADAATDVNGQTTMSGDITAGDCADGVSVVCQGYVLGSPEICLSTILIRSPDMNGDLAVNLQDFSEFGLSYPPNAYGTCADFNCDAQVDLQDFSLFGLHFQHACQ